MPVQPRSAPARCAGATNTIPQNSAVVLGLGGTLQLNGFSQSVGSLTGGGVVTDNSSTSATLTIGNDGTSPSAFYGVLSNTTASNTGTLALSKVGGGVITLSGLNTYTGGTTVSDGILATVSGGTLGPGSLSISAANSSVFAEANIGTSQSVSSLHNTNSAGGQTALSVASGVTLTSTGVLTNTGTLVFGSGSGTVVVDGAPTLAANSKLQVNSGTLEFNVTSGTASVGSGVTATVASGATLQLAGTVSALSDGSAQTPADGQLVNITNNGSTASGGGLSVTGTNQAVGTIAGTGTTSGGATTYTGDTMTAAGASLTASQILQNSLTIGAGSTVTIRPSGSAGSPAASDSTASNSSVAATSQEIATIQNRIAVLEQLEAADSASDASPLDAASPAVIGSAVASSNSAVANPADAGLSSGSEAALLAGEIDRLLTTENTLLAEEGLPPVSPAGSIFAASSSGDSPSAAVPEPSAALLALIAILLVCGFSWRRKLDPRRRIWQNSAG